MKLILVDKIAIPYLRSNGDLFIHNITTTPSDVTWLESSNENKAKALISEIFAGKSCCLISIQLYQFKNEEPKDSFSLQLHRPMHLFGSSEPDIFRKLRERFQDKVKISVGVATSSHPNDYLSTSEMTISSSNTCVCKIPELGAHLWQKMATGPGIMHVSIIAHLPNDDDNEPIYESGQIPRNHRKILEDGLFTDVTIHTGNGTQVKAHKCFLSASSDVLQANFLSGMEESQTNSLDMTDMSEKGVRAFLRYVYYEELEEHMKDLDLAFELFCAAHKYNVSTLEGFFVKYLLSKHKEFTVELAFKIYTYSRTIESAADLKVKALKVLTLKMGELEAMPEYNELFQKTPDAAKELCRELVNAAMALK